MDKPLVAQKSPYMYKAEKDEKIAWCSCGKSANQPFCDGAHKGSEFKPLIYDLKSGEGCAFCGCKQTQNAPFCDGSHSKID